MVVVTTADIYVRMSVDTAGEELGIDRQEEECRAWCELRGWNVGRVFADNDLSATKRNVVRPAFEQLLTSNPEVIVCWHSDRFLRLSSELERVIELGVNIHAVHTGHLDLSTPAGRAVARTVTAWAQYEGEQKALRQRASNRQKAALGKHSWTKVPLGYTKSGELVESEASEVRKAYDQVLEGRTLYAIAQDWAGQRLGERKWTPTAVRTLLLSPRNAGIATYLGEEIGPGDWEPIVDEELFRGVEALLKAEGRTGMESRGRKPVTMLAGIAICAVCRAPAKTQKNRGNTYYVCGRSGHFYAPVEQVDSLVLWRIVEALNEEDVQRYWLQRRGSEPDRSALLAEEAVLRGRLEEAAQAYAEGVLTMQQVATINKSVGADLEAVEARLGALKPVYQASLLLRDLEAVWEQIEDMGLADLRQLVQEVCDGVMIKPRENRRTAFARRHLGVTIDKARAPAIQ